MSALDTLARTFLDAPEGMPLDLWLRASEVIEESIAAALDVQDDGQDYTGTLQPAIAKALLEERNRRA